MTYDTTPQGAATPSDAEILALNVDERYFSESPTKYPEAGHGTQYHAGAPGVVAFARAVLARWGAPQAAALPPHVPLTDDQMREVLTDEAFAGETKSEKSKWAVHEKSMLIMIDFCRAVERAHGIAAA